MCMTWMAGGKVEVAFVCFELLTLKLHWGNQGYRSGFRLVASTDF